MIAANNGDLHGDNQRDRNNVQKANMLTEKGELIKGFGDMPNDLPMLDWAGHSVAMANAHASVLAASDEVTLSNEQDGVAKVVERPLEQREPQPVTRPLVVLPLVRDVPPQRGVADVRELQEVQLRDVFGGSVDARKHLDRAPLQRDALRVRHRRQIHVADRDAAGIGLIEAAEDMQQRALPHA